MANPIALGSFRSIIGGDSGAVVFMLLGARTLLAREAGHTARVAVDAMKPRVHGVLYDLSSTQR